jgi:hypothetical protein
MGKQLSRNFPPACGVISSKFGDELYAAAALPIRAIGRSRQGLGNVSSVSRQRLLRS